MRFCICVELSCVEFKAVVPNSAVRGFEDYEKPFARAFNNRHNGYLALIILCTYYRKGGCLNERKYY